MFATVKKPENSGTFPVFCVTVFNALRTMEARTWLLSLFHQPATVLFYSKPACRREGYPKFLEYIFPIRGTPAARYTFFQLSSVFLFFSIRGPVLLSCSLCCHSRSWDEAIVMFGCIYLITFIVFRNSCTLITPLQTCRFQKVPAVWLTHFSFPSLTTRPK